MSLRFLSGERLAIVICENGFASFLRLYESSVDVGGSGTGGLGHCPPS